MKVISRKQLPIKPPVVGTTFWLVVLDVYNAPGYLWGIVVTILTIAWIGVVITAVRDEQVEVEL